MIDCTWDLWLKHTTLRLLGVQTEKALFLFRPTSHAHLSSLLTNALDRIVVRLIFHP